MHVDYLLSVIKYPKVIMYGINTTIKFTNDAVDEPKN